ncbi:DEAD/DEAH box helicase [Cytobacillus sp. S13-E01]|uniref:DEAD/DEAH box helicase n=1 Tax=Cytobacillus sp. S13-E01 TaxID=3031326 RepID=UPI0023D7C4D4|nr:DEAD/DEAH box helicase [Cytobacillus sp. S13-E01]MDF0728434.1 DEAD/DEAH box helicase [Cytobacillus sp. S13-E01]
MDFRDLFSRADEETLQDILGTQTIRILSNLDDTRSYNKYLRKLILDLYGAEGLLLNKNFRSYLFDLLRQKEAEILANLIGVKYSNTKADLYKKLKIRSIKRGSDDEKRLFQFFNLPEPIEEEKIIKPDFGSVNSNYSLFPHQRKAARDVKNQLTNPPYRVLLHMPTGSGKTRTAMNIISEHLRENEPTVVIWLATSEELCEQAVEEFNKSWSFLGNRGLNVYRFWGAHELPINDINDGFIVAGLSKLVRSVNNIGGIDFIRNLGNKISLVIMDEAHQAIAPTYKIILNTLFYVGSENKLLGLSATPGRTWNNVDADRELSEFFSKRKVKLEIEGFDNPVDYLIEENYLAKVQYNNLFYEGGKISAIDIESLTKALEIPLQILKQLGDDEKRNLKIIYEVEKMIKRHKRIILFAPSVSSSNLLASVLKARGHNAFSITGETQPTQRRMLINNYKDNEEQTKILCNYGVLTTGFDAPQTSAAIIARPTFSLVLYSQMVGRAIRGLKAGGNKEAEIVTIVDKELPGFGSVAESFNNWEDVWNDGN